MNNSSGTKFISVIQFVILIYLIPYHCFTLLFISLTKSSIPDANQMPPDTIGKLITIICMAVIFVSTFISFHGEPIRTTHNGIEFQRIIWAVFLIFLIGFHSYLLISFRSYIQKAPPGANQLNFLLPEILTIIIFIWNVYKSIANIYSTKD